MWDNPMNIYDPMDGAKRKAAHLSKMKANKARAKRKRKGKSKKTHR